MYKTDLLGSYFYTPVGERKNSVLTVR